MGRFVEKKDHAADAARRRGDRLGALVVAGGLLALYLATLCPTIHSGDAAELATAGSTFGIAHPPGYALYSLVANLWCRLLPFGEVAWRLNLLSALAATGAAVLLYTALLRLDAGRVAAAFAALGLGVGATFWSQALVSEVYAFDLLLAAASLTAALRARQRDSLGSVVLALACLGLWLCHRTVNLLYVPALLILLWPQLMRHGASWRGLAAMAVGLLAPLSAQLYLPLASSMEPMLDTGDPETWSRFWELVSAKVYRRYLFAGNWWDNAGLILSGLPRDLGASLPLAALGPAIWWRNKRHQPALLALGALALGNLAFASSYGVPDVAVFVLPALLALAALAGLGFSYLAQRLPAGGAAALAAALVLALAGYNLRDNNLRQQTLARDFARDALSFPGKDALVLSHVDTVSFSLWYAQYVEQRRPDLLVVSRGRAVDWHQLQAARLRPDLAVPRHDGPDAISRWPAMLVRRNGRKVPVYVTANLAGYFSPADAVSLGREFQEAPAGVMTRLVPRDRPLAVAQVVQRNREFWRRAWPHVVAARAQRLNSDLTSLALHYASMRMLFARYCLQHGQAAAAEQAARAVVELDSAALIEAVNVVYARMNARYHMSQMPAAAQALMYLARAVGAGRVSQAEAMQRLASVLPTGPRRPPRPGVAPPAAVPGAGPTVTEPPEVAAWNMQGIKLAKQGQLATALPLFDRVLRRMPEHRGALFNRAKVLAMLGHQAKAVAAYEALLKLSPQHLPALVGLGDLVVKTDPQQALKLYRAALAAPGPPQLKAEVSKRVQALAGGQIKNKE